MLRSGHDRGTHAARKRASYGGAAPIVAQVLGLLLLMILLGGFVSGGWSLVSQFLAPPYMQVEAYGLLTAAPGLKDGAMAIDGEPAPAAMVVVLRGTHANGLLATRVRIWSAPVTSLSGHCASVTLGTVFGDQTVAVILPCKGSTGLAKINVTVGRWKTPPYIGSPLPPLRWHRGAHDVQVQLTNGSQETTGPVLLVVGFFNRYGSIVGAGERSVLTLRPGEARHLIIPVQFGTDMAPAHAAVFEERA